MLAYLTRSDKNAAGFVAYTASHSPYTDGGIKYSPPHGGAAPSKVTDLITAYANGTDESLMAEDYREAIEAGAIEELSPEQAVGMYVNEYIIPKLKSLGAWQSIVDHIKANPDFRLVLDPMQGSAVRYFQSLYGALAKDAGRDFFTIINADNSDPTFSQVNKEPNPTKEKSRAGLISKVKEGAGRWMGSSADADSDRFGNIDLNGDFMSANDMIAMIAYFLNKEIGVKGRIGKTVATSNFVNAIARHLGLEVDEFAVGFKNIVASALEGREYVVGGEESSHVMVGPFQDSWDDGIVVGVMGLWMLAKTGKSLTEYKKEIQKALGQKFLIETLTIRGADDSIKRPVLDIIARTKEELASGKTREDLTVVRDIERITGETVQDLITKDGVKLVLPSGWILLRPSGTEPAIKFYVEVASPFTADDDQMKAQFDNLVKSGKILMFGDADHAMSVDDGSAIDDDAVAPDVTGMIRYQGAPLPAEILKREVDRIKAAFDFEKNLPDTSWRAMTWTVLFSGNKKEVDLVQADISAVVNDLSRHAPLLMKSRPRWTPEGKIFFEIVLGIRHNLPKETVPARRLPFAERKKQELKEQKRREYDVASVQVTVDTWVRNTERMLNAAAAPAVEEKAPEQVAQTIAYKDLEAPRQDWVAAERIVQEAFDRVISQESKRPEDVLPDLSDVFLARVNQKSPLEVQRSFGKIVELLVRGLGETTLRSKVYVDDHANTETAFVLRIKHINKTSHKKNLEDIKSKQKMASQWFQDRLKQPVATAEETADPAEKMVTIKGVTASVSDWLAAVWVIDNQFINKLDKLLTHTNQVGFDHRVERLKVVAPLKRIQTRLAQWPIRVHFGPVDQGTPRGRAFVNIVDALAAELGVSAEPIVIHDDSDDFVASYMVTILPVSARSGVMNFVDISAKVDKWCDDIRAQVTGLSSDKAEITINGVTMSDRQWLEAAATLEDVLKEGDIKKDFWPGSDIAIDLFKVREGRTSAEQDRVLAVARILAPEINASVAEVREGDYAPTLVAWQLHIRHDQRVYAIDRWSEWPDRKERALNRLDEIKASVIDRSRATAAEEGSFYQAPVTHESVTLFEEDWNGVIAALERAFAKEPAWSNAGGVIVEVVNIDERGTFALKDKIIRVARAMAADMKKTVVQVREDGRMAQLYAEPDLFKYGLDPLKQWPDRQAEAMAWLEGAKAAVAAARNETLSEEPAYLRAQKDAAEFVKGGIDLGTGNYLTVIARDAAGMPQFDPAQLKALQHDLRGIVPVAVGAPVPADLQLLLGK